MFLEGRPAKRLRQLRSVAARGLGVEPGGGAYFSLYLPCASPGPEADAAAHAEAGPRRSRSWRALYKSEAVRGTLNPEWEPLGIDYDDAPAGAGSAAEVLLAVHLLPPSPLGPAAGSELARPATLSADAAPSLLTHDAQPSGQQSPGTAATTAQAEGEPPVADGERVEANGSSALAAPPCRADALDSACAAQGVAPAAPVDVFDELEAQLASTFPGRPCLAWRCHLDGLVPLGSDLGEVSAPLEQGSLVFEFAGGQYYCSTPPVQPPLPPPPKPAAAPSSAPSVAASAASTPAAPPAVAHGAPPLAAAAKAASTAASTAAVAEGRAETDEGDAASSAADASSSEDHPTAAAAGGAASSQSLGGLLLSKLLGSTPSGAAAAAAAAGSAPGTPRPQQDAGSEDDSSAAAIALAAPPSFAAPQRRGVSVRQLQAQVHEVLALRRGVRAARARCTQLRADLEAALARQEEGAAQQRQLAAAAAEAAEARRLAGALQGRAAAAQAGGDAARRAAVVHAQALAATLAALQGAERRVREAGASLHGEAGAGRLAAALRELVARRCVMAVQAGWAYRLAPATVRVLRPPPGGLLEAQLDVAWAGAAPSSAGAHEEPLALAADAAAAVCGPGAAVDGGAGAGQGGGGGASGALLGASYRQEVQLSIGGLRLDPSVWRKAFEADGYDWDAGEDRAAAVALGYTAHLADRVAAYCGVPLRYPVVFRGSASSILDNYPPVGAWPEHCGVHEPGAAASGSLFGRAAAAAPGRAPAEPVEYPLHCASNRDRPRFAVGVFLLNKDVIQLLQAHGVSAAGPNQLLQNLHKLLACARSGLL